MSKYHYSTEPQRNNSLNKRMDISGAKTNLRAIKNRIKNFDTNENQLLKNLRSRLRMKDSKRTTSKQRKPRVEGVQKKMGERKEKKMSREKLIKNKQLAGRVGNAFQNYSNMDPRLRTKFNRVTRISEGRTKNTIPKGRKHSFQKFASNTKRKGGSKRRQMSTSKVLYDTRLDKSIISNKSTNKSETGRSRMSKSRLKNYLKMKKSIVGDFQNRYKKNSRGKKSGIFKALNNSKVKKALKSRSKLGITKKQRGSRVGSRPNLKEGVVNEKSIPRQISSRIDQLKNIKRGSELKKNFRNMGAKYVRSREKLVVSNIKQGMIPKEHKKRVSGWDKENIEKELNCYETLKESKSDLQNQVKKQNFFSEQVTDFTSDSNLQMQSYLTIPQKLNSNTFEDKNIRISDQLLNFEQESFEGYGPETIEDMIKIEGDYSPDPHYLDKRNKKATTNDEIIRWDMRAMLLDWMIEVASDYALKISTFQMGVNFVDRFMASAEIGFIRKDTYQLVGLTAMNVATKMEEVFVPKLEEFGYSASNQFTVDEIKKMEQKMLKTLKWRVNPPTLHLWANWYTAKWDFFLANSPEAIYHPLLRHVKNGKIFFRSPDKASYYRYREIMQLLDCSLLDIQTLQYKLRPLVAGFMYIILGRDYDQFNSLQILEKFPTSSLYLLNDNFAFNNLFSIFLKQHFGMELGDLLPCIQFASTFFGLKLSMDLPSIFKMNKDGILKDGHFEQFLSYQVHNSHCLNFILKERNRNLV